MAPKIELSSRDKGLLLILSIATLPVMIAGICILIVTQA
jgi:hypothetical protein